MIERATICWFILPKSATASFRPSWRHEPDAPCLFHMGRGGASVLEPTSVTFPDTFAGRLIWSTVTRTQASALMWGFSSFDPIVYTLESKTALITGRKISSHAVNFYTLNLEILSWNFQLGNFLCIYEIVSVFKLRKSQ